jgi:putative transposase
VTSSSSRPDACSVTLNATDPLPLEALELAVWTRPRARLDGLVQHTDAGSQYLGIRYVDAVSAVGAVASVGTVGDSYDNALAESTIGQLKAELVHRRGPWRTIEQQEFALFEYLDWWNHRRLHSEIGMITPVEKEAAYYRQTRSLQAADSQ